MKQKMIRGLGMILVVLALSSPALARRSGGNSVGNGGGTTAQQFTWTARWAIGILKSMPLSEEQRGYLLRIEEAVRTVHVGSKARLILRGLPVDAINYPDRKLIVVSREGWILQKKLSRPARAGFVLHEYARVADLESEDHYDISYALTNYLRDNRRIDDTEAERVFDQLAAVGKELQKYHAEIPAAASTDTADVVRRTCLASGRLRGASVMVDVLMRVTPIGFGKKSSQNLRVLEDASSKLESQCYAKHVDRADLQRTFSEATVAIQSLIGP